MNALILLVATTAVGVNFGQKAMPDGNLEYIIQIEPDFCQSLPAEGLTSQIPPDMQHAVKKFRVVVGNELLPHDPIPPALGARELQPIQVRPSQENGLEPKSGSLSPIRDPFKGQRTNPNQQPQQQDDGFDPLRGNQNNRQQGNPFDNDRGNTEASKRPELPGSTFANNNNTEKFTSGYPNGENGPLQKNGETEKPWWALTASLVALFASLGGNLYQGLAHFNLRQRYQSLIQRMQSPARA